MCDFTAPDSRCKPYADAHSHPGYFSNPHAHTDAHSFADGDNGSC